MSDDIFYKSIETAYALGYKKINFTPTTGELFLHKKWSEYVQYVLSDARSESVYFYSNAILLDEETVNKIASLGNPEKISAIFFSVGGVDRDSYELMYGVDKFETVCKNINLLCEKLLEINSNIKVNCELRIPSNIQPDIEQISKRLNIVDYKNFHLDYIDRYDDIGGTVKSENLKLLKQRDKTTPCYRLNDIRFDIHGDIWACGCVVTEQINNYELRLGDFGSGYDDIVSNKEKLLEKWNLGKIPSVCLGCRLYKGI